MKQPMTLEPEAPQEGEVRRYCVWDGDTHIGYVVKRGSGWFAISWPCRNRRTALNKLVQARWA